MRSPAWSWIVVALLGAAGCGLLSSDITAVNFDLPSKSYTFNASALNLPAGTTTAVPCGGSALVADCCNPPQPFPPVDCTATPLICAANPQGVDVCTAHVAVTQSAPMNLSQDVSKLSSATRLANLRIKAIRYDVPNNSLNVDLPSVAIFLAPSGVTSASDPQARKFGTVPAIPAGTMVASGNVTLEPDATATFSSFTQDLSKPFNFITTAVVDVPSGSPVPSGSIQIDVTGTLSASL